MHVIKNSRIEEVDDGDVADYELLSPNQQWANNINLIPAQNAVQGARLFYGARFFNQAMPIVSGEAPLVQTLKDDDPDGRSWEETSSTRLGALLADEDAEVVDVDDKRILLRGAGGDREVQLFRNMPYNRKSGLDQTAVVKPGDKIAKGQLLARSNYTDDQGRMSMGLNARIALLPFRGWSMDDAVVVSQDFADRLTSDHMETYDQEFDDNIKGGFHHFVSLFPKQFTKDQLSKLDDATGVVKVGQVLEPGDPIFLATRPRTFSSASASLGNLSRAVRMSRSNASQTWDSDVPGEVTDVVHTKDGSKVVIRSRHPAQVGDKIVLRSGNKGVISKILSKDEMPMTADGKPLDVLLNQLGLDSRTNAALPVELWMGKVAAAKGAPVKLPAFNKPGENWIDMVQQALQDAGLRSEEEIYDPAINRKLRRPVAVGNGYIMKLHHVAKSKLSARGQASYDLDEQPVKGGGEGAQAKRLSGLEAHALLSSGAYATLREGATLRGQKNDEYWRVWREGGQPRPPGKPFVWGKFLALLKGAGLDVSDKGKGTLRLGPVTDKAVDALDPVEVRSGDTVDLRTMEPKAGGLFDTSLVGANRWGYIRLPRPMPNPAYQDTIRQLLGLKKAELEAILAGDMELPEHLR